jgi:hypothetical protein
VFRTSALRGTGVPELAAFLRAHVALPDAAALRRKELHFLRRAIAERYGDFGLDVLGRFLADGGARRPDARYEDLETEALDAIAARLR